MAPELSRMLRKRRSISSFPRIKATLGKKDTNVLNHRAQFTHTESVTDEWNYRFLSPSWNSTLHSRSSVCFSFDMKSTQWGFAGRYRANSRGVASLTHIEVRLL
jgi:hypothetical protein